VEQKCKINVSGVNEIIPHQFFETKRIPGFENSTSKSEERTTSMVDDFHEREHNVAFTGSNQPSIGKHC